MFDKQHDDDTKIIANWLTSDLHPNEYGNERFINQMAYKYRNLIDRYPQEKRNNEDIIYKCLNNAYDEIKEKGY